ncbi:amidohydrolase family protein [Haloferula sp.]|uniref:amidohydrolase family protein n=1 Tax=Haloferula sp. TaxID=2497595 RepID=UPI00329B324D
MIRSYFLAGLLLIETAAAQLVIKGELLHTMTGDLEPIKNGVVVCGADGKISAVGKQGEVELPEGAKVIEASVVTPGIIDARSSIGLSGLLNLPRHDQEQLDHTSPVQPELRAFDAYNGRDPLVKWVRDLGITTIHTGHAPGALVAGQTMVVKTDVASIVSPDDTLLPLAMVAVSLSKNQNNGQVSKAPGTRAKSMAVLRSELVKAREHARKAEDADAEKTPEPNLKLDILAAVLRKETPLLIQANRHHDITAAIRLQQEFGFDLVLEGASEAYLVLDEIKASGCPVLVHPTMARSFGDRRNMTFKMAAELHKAGIPFAFQSGFEAYVPKTRVVLFEAGAAAAHGLPPKQTLAACTIRPAEILGLADYIGSLEVGKDADLALFEGDPLETVTRCSGVVIGGKLRSSEPH